MKTGNTALTTTPPPALDEHCEACNGTGWTAERKRSGVTIGSNVCPRCDGSGRIPYVPCPIPPTAHPALDDAAKTAILAYLATPEGRAEAQAFDRSALGDMKAALMAAIQAGEGVQMLMRHLLAGDPPAPMFQWLLDMAARGTGQFRSAAGIFGTLLRSNAPIEGGGKEIKG